VLNASLAANKAVLSVALPFRRGAAAAGLPQRVKILGWGENIGRTTGARILVDESTVATLTANQELVACDLVPLDYEHQSEPTHPNYIPDPRLSPGAGKIEVVSGEGVYLSAITYTANGEQYADSYQDVSAVVRLDKASRPLWISSVALTQRGDLAGMELAESIAALSAQINSTTMTDPNATYRPILLKLLKLPDTASEEDIIAASEKESSEPNEPTDMTDADTAALSARLDALEATHSTQCRQALVDAACRAGKVITLSAELIAETPLAVLSAILDGLPANVVPMQTTTGKEIPSEKTAVLSADEKGAAKRLGLTEEEFAKGKL
jgi:phage I-like protein